MSRATMRPASGAAQHLSLASMRGSRPPGRVHSPRRSAEVDQHAMGRARSRRPMTTTTSAGPRLSQITIHRQVCPERDEHEDHDQRRRWCRWSAQCRWCWCMHSEPEAIHVADDQTGEEMLLGTRPSRGSPSRSSRRQRLRRLRSWASCHMPPAGRRRRAKAGSRPDPQHCRYAEVLRKSNTGSAMEASPLQTTP